MRNFDLDLQLFASTIATPLDGVNANVNVTTQTASGADMSPSMKTFYKTSLLQNARNEHYFAQFGMKQALPKNGGNTVEWRKFNTYAKATTPLTEGVTPDGNSVGMTKLTAEIAQYGDYTTVSDRLELEAVDPVIASITEEHGAQAGDTIDTLARNITLQGTNVIYAGGKTSRSALTAADVITPTLVNQAATMLKKQHAPTIDGSYVAIIHPSCSYDLRESDDWIDVQKYMSAEKIYNGEIGKLHNVRFIEDTEAKIWNEGASSVAVYGIIVFGKDAWGIIDPSAESMEVIVKQRGSAGTADPLDQRSTVGWKASFGGRILYNERIVRIECGSYYSSVDTEN